MRSLRSRLWVLWGLTFAASLAVGLLLFQLYRASTQAQLGQAEAVAQRSCDLIRESYAFYVTGWDGADASPADAGFRRDLVPVIGAALMGQRGVGGGIWSATAGSMAYAFPGYSGTGSALSLPAAERVNIEAVNEDAANGEQPALRRSHIGAQTVLTAACPLQGPYAGMTAWTMTRIRAATGYDRLSSGLALLFALVIGIAGWVTWLTTVWARHVAAIETTLTRHDLEELPLIPRTRGTGTGPHRRGPQRGWTAACAGPAAVGRDGGQDREFGAAGRTRAGRSGRRARDPQPDGDDAAAGRKRACRRSRAPARGAGNQPDPDRARRLADRRTFWP